MTINDCCEILGETIHRSMKEEPWTKAVLNIRKLERSTRFDGEYWDADGAEKNMDVDIDMPTFNAVDRIYEIMTDNKPNSIHKWNSAKFHLTYEGRFSMDFTWDQELHDKIERLNREARSSK